MRRNPLISIAVTMALSVAAAGAALANIVGPGPGITGNDTGGIIPYSPGLEGIYKDMAAAHCAQWGRLSHVTSVHRHYGDYISFVCIDKPWMIH